MREGGRKQEGRRSGTNCSPVINPKQSTNSVQHGRVGALALYVCDRKLCNLSLEHGNGKFTSNILIGFTELKIKKEGGRK